MSSLIWLQSTQFCEIVSFYSNKWSVKEKNTHTLICCSYIICHNVKRFQENLKCRLFFCCCCCSHYAFDSSKHSPFAFNLWHWTLYSSEHSVSVRSIHLVNFVFLRKKINVLDKYRGLFHSIPRGWSTAETNNLCHTFSCSEFCFIIKRTIAWMCVNISAAILIEDKCVST